MIGRALRLLAEHELTWLAFTWSEMRMKVRFLAAGPDHDVSGEWSRASGLVAAW